MIAAALLLLALQAGVEASAQGPAEPVELGAPFPLVVTRRWPKDATPPAWKDDALAPLRVVSRGVEAREEGGRVVETRRFDARAFEREPVEVPALRLRVEVKSALADPASPVELPAGPLPLPFPWLRALAIALGALAAAALVAAAVVLGRRRRRRAAGGAPATPPLPADVRALARLGALRGLAFADEAALQRFVVEASSAVREYVEERFRVRAPEMTTEEFLASEAARLALEPAHRAALADFLGRCDLVKFARHVPSAADLDRLLDAAVRFVQETSLSTATAQAVGAAA